MQSKRSFPDAGLPGPRLRPGLHVREFVILAEKHEYLDPCISAANKTGSVYQQHRHFSIPSIEAFHR